MQSFIVVANNQEIHQTDPQHLKVEHSHQNHSTVDESTEQAFSDHNEEDCHHCGHCHGSHMQWDYYEKDADTELLLSPMPFYATEMALIRFLDNDLRPPIA